MERRKRKGIMLCYPFEEKRLTKWGAPYVLTQPKLNGERCKAVCIDSHVTLYSSTAREITTAPHIAAEIEDHSIYLGNNFTLDGELYVHNAPLEWISGIVHSDVNYKNDAHLMDYHVFDCYTSETIKDNNLHRIVDLNRFFFNIREKLGSSAILPIKQVPTFTDFFLDDIIAHLNQFLSEGYEGIIVRNPLGLYEEKRSTNIMKLKPHREDIYTIIGVTEECDYKTKEPKNSLGSFIVKDDDDRSFRVGSGFTQQQRRSLWENRHNLIGKFLRVGYQHTSNGGIPLSSIFLEVIENG